MRNGRTRRGQQRGLVPPPAQSSERQQCLALPAAPFPLQINVENPHSSAIGPRDSLGPSSNVIRQAERRFMGLRVIAKSALVSHKANLRNRNKEESAL